MMKANEIYCRVYDSGVIEINRQSDGKRRKHKLIAMANRKQDNIIVYQQVPENIAKLILVNLKEIDRRPKGNYFIYN